MMSQLNTSVCAGDIFRSTDGHSKSGADLTGYVVIIPHVFTQSSDAFVSDEWNRAEVGPEVKGLITEATNCPRGYRHLQGLHMPAIVSGLD